MVAALMLTLPIVGAATTIVARALLVAAVSRVVAVRRVAVATAHRGSAMEGANHVLMRRVGLMIHRFVRSASRQATARVDAGIGSMKIMFQKNVMSMPQWPWAPTTSTQTGILTRVQQIMSQVI
jgi:hypothetical protein